MIYFAFILSLSQHIVTCVADQNLSFTLLFAVAFQVVLLNITITVVNVFLRVITTAANRWLFGEYVCVITGFINFMTYIMRVILMFVLVVDRFLTVFKPYKYPKHRAKVIAIMSCVSWLMVGAVCTVMLPKILDCYGYIPLAYYCGVTCCNTSCDVLLNLCSLFYPLSSFQLSST